MISRYAYTAIEKIWSDHHKFEKYFEVEMALLKALEIEHLIPQDTHKEFQHAKIHLERILEIEETTRHDVIAFCTSITEQVPPEFSKYFHYGVTSSDIIDTAHSLLLKESLWIQIGLMEDLLISLKSLADKTKDLLTMGRSHGIYAEPMSFGQKILGFYAELKRRTRDTRSLLQTELTAQISGSVGNYAILSPKIEIHVASHLGLSVEELSTQILPRDRIAKILQANALTAAFIERFCIELRHLHHSDLKEVSEGFKKGQKGSSIMPHKKNPISSENLSGLSRVLRSHSEVALQNTLLWHERDISHSSAERLILPDNFGLMCYALNRLNETVKLLEIHEDAIEGKVLNEASYLSSYYLHFLIDQIPNFKREDLYPILQQVSFDLKNKTPEGFRLSLKKSLEAQNIHIDLPLLNKDGIKKIYLKHTDEIFQRFEN